MMTTLLYKSLYFTDILQTSIEKKDTYNDFLLYFYPFFAHRLVSNFDTYVILQFFLTKDLFPINIDKIQAIINVFCSITDFFFSRFSVSWNNSFTDNSCQFKCHFTIKLQ